MSRARLLVVDDEAEYVDLLSIILRREGHDCDVETDGVRAIARLHASAYDLLMLDLSMSPVSGLEVLAAARRQDPDLVVIMVTAFGSLDTAVEALRLGAFDYVAKPFDLEQILARVRAGLEQRRLALERRRLLSKLNKLQQVFSEVDDELVHATPPPAHDRFVSSGPLRIDLHRRMAILDGQPLDLTTIEFDLLVHLVGASPDPLAPTDLVRDALGYAGSGSEARDTVKYHIHRLRRKIEPDPAHPRYIKTVRYRGYLWSGD